jgi:hypothetical protein
MVGCEVVVGWSSVSLPEISQLSLVVAAARRGIGTALDLLGREKFSAVTRGACTLFNAEMGDVILDVSPIS